MFEGTRIKIHSLVVKVIKKKQEPVFVNPYAQPALPKLNPKLNPYVVDYGSKKKKTMKEWLLGFVIKEKKPDIPEFTFGLPRHNITEEPINKTVAKEKRIRKPPLVRYMKRVFNGDVEYVASIINHPTCRTCRERNMTDIARTCESFKWAHR